MILHIAFALILKTISLMFSVLLKMIHKTKLEYLRIRHIHQWTKLIKLYRNIEIDSQSWAFTFRVLTVNLTRYWLYYLYWMKKISISTLYVYRNFGSQTLMICLHMSFLATNWSIALNHVPYTVDLSYRLSESFHMMDGKFAIENIYIVLPRITTPMLVLKNFSMN